MPHTDILPTVPDLMRAIVLHEPNQQITLSEIELPVPQVMGNDVLIKVEYVGLNHVDGQFAKQGFCKWQYPHVLGLDAVGLIVHAERGVFPGVGTRVMFHGNIGEQGVLSHYVKVPNFAVSIIPDSIAFDQAATLPCAGMSALVALDKLQLSEGDSILIEAGAGAVGQFAIQLAKQRGATVFTTASKQNHKLVKQLGADSVYDYSDKKLTDKIRRDLGPQGFDAVLDSIGGQTTVRNIELMRFCGRIACLNPLPHFEQELMFRRAPNIGIVSLGGAWLANSLCAQQKMSFMGNLLLENVANNELLTPNIIPVDFNAQSISAALNKQLEGGLTGKHIVKVSHA